MTAFLSYLAAHPKDVVEAIVAVIGVLSVIAGATPQAAQRMPWLGWLVRFARRWGAAKHRDEPGTLSVPGVIEAVLDAARPSDPPGDPPGERKTPVVPPPAAMGVLLALALGLSQLACGPRPWHQTAHIAINSAAYGVRAADTIVAQAIERDARTRDGDSLERQYRPAITAMGAVRASLIAAQSAVDAAVATQSMPARCHARVLIDQARAAAEQLAVQLREAGVAVPDEVPRAVRLCGELAATLAPQCEPDGSAALQPTDAEASQ